ncbi:MAG: hypothetical protein HY658_06010 [Actinobacteria bacterium]|nr:hypothetical protein [Actinomycetota bacterium]
MLRGDGRAVPLEQEADRYLSLGRLTILRADRHLVEATCEGRSRTHRLGYEPGRGWWCSCERDTCPHVMAAMKVTRPVHPAAASDPAFGFQDD